MSDSNLESWICLALMRLGTRMATGFDQRFAEIGITQAQFRILLALRELGGEGGSAPSTLADYLLIERGTMSVLSNRLVEHGWLSRETGKNRRTYRLALTEAGHHILDQVMPLADGMADDLLSGMLLAELQQFYTHLQVLEAKLRPDAPAKDQPNND